jgi:energy-converting hydrogenase Eha subunit E
LTDRRSARSLLVIDRGGGVTIADLPMLMGAMLVVVGTLLVVVQFFRPAERRHAAHSRNAEISPKGVSLRTTYPGW